MGPAGVLVFASVFVEIGCALRAFSCFCACTPDDHCDSEAQTSARTATTPTIRRDSLIFMMQTPGKVFGRAKNTARRVKSKGQRAKGKSEAEEMNIPNEFF